MIRQGYFRLVEKHEKTENLKDDYNNVINLRTMGECLKL